MCVTLQKPITFTVVKHGHSTLLSSLSQEYYIT